MNVLEMLRQYFMTYSGLSDLRIDINCLSSEPDSYSIDSVPCQRVVTQYLDGSAVCRCLFTLSSRRFYASDLTLQREALDFFEGLELWLAGQQSQWLLPSLGSGRTARSLTTLSSAYPIAIDGDEGTARYQIQMELIYLQEV